jgi:hypothetical protein
MGSTSRLAMLRDVGVVTMKDALVDGATMAEERAKGCGVDLNTPPKVLKEYYWCTLCTQCLKKTAAYTHRERHALEWGGLRDPERVLALQVKLDKQYGDSLILRRGDCRSCIMCVS